MKNNISGFWERHQSTVSENDVRPMFVPLSMEGWEHQDLITVTEDKDMKQKKERCLLLKKFILLDLISS